MTATERHLRIAATVDDLPAAWAFVMKSLDELSDTQQITIRALMQSDEWNPVTGQGGDDWVRRYEVTVEGAPELAW